MFLSLQYQDKKDQCMALALPSKDAIRWSGDKVISRASMIMILSLFSVNHR